MVKGEVAAGVVGALAGGLAGGVAGYVVGTAKAKPPLDIKVWCRDWTHEEYFVPAHWADRLALQVGRDVWLYLFEDLPEGHELRDDDFTDFVVLVVKGPRPRHPEEAWYVSALQSSGGMTYDVYINDVLTWEEVPGYWVEERFRILTVKIPLAGAHALEILDSESPKARMMRKPEATSEEDLWPIEEIRLEAR